MVSGIESFKKWFACYGDQYAIIGGTAQAMRLPTYDKPRIISCADETGEYLCLPRGCEADLYTIFNDLGIDVYWIDKTNPGKGIDVEFSGSLRDEQPLAMRELLKCDNGLLSGTTAFGKTIVAIKLIAERKVNTLIMVDKVNLVSQWKKKLTDFLRINESLPDTGQEKRRGRKKTKSIIGQIGAGKDSLSGIIDIAIMQSLNRMGEVKECVKNYGMIIVEGLRNILCNLISFKARISGLAMLSRVIHCPYLLSSQVREAGIHAKACIPLPVYHLNKYYTP